MATPPNPLAFLGMDVPPEALQAARAAALRKQVAQRPATAEETGALGAIGPSAALSPSMALAEALRNRVPNTGAYELFSGDDEGAVRARAEGVNLGLGRQRAAGNLGLLTGDRVLGGFGRAQLEGADKQEGMLAEAGQFRAGQTLKQALAAEEAKRQARIDTERERHNRTMEARPPSNVFLPGAGGQYFMGSTRGDGPLVPVVDPNNNPVFSPKADELKAAEEKADTDAKNKITELETKYRTEFQNLPPVKEYQLAAIGLDKVRHAARSIQASVGANKEPTPADDIALVFGYMKTIDPTSVVKETEFATAQNAANVPDQIRNLWGRVKTGNRLNPQQRQEFIASAESQFKAYETRAKALSGGYIKMAREQGLDPSRVILDGLMVEDAAPAGTPSAAPTPRGPPTLSSTNPRRAPMPEGELTDPSQAQGAPAQSPQPTAGGTTPSGRRIIRPPANIPPPETDPLRKNAVQGQGTEAAPYIISVAGQKAGYIQSFLSDGEVAYVRDLDGGRVVEKVNGKIRYADGKPPPRFKKAEGK